MVIPAISLEHYITALRRMNVAVIFLDERKYKGEDPQIIFETLNSLGKPLSLSDLIRNYILLDMPSDRQYDTYEEKWFPKIEAVLKEKTSMFFRDYLQYKKSATVKVVSDNNTKEIYKIFKDFVEERFKENDIIQEKFEVINNFIDDIIPYVKCYKWIITEIVNDSISLDTKNDKEIKELLRNIFFDIKSEAFKPFVLGLLHYHQVGVNNVRISDELIIDVLKTIRTYLIRRRIAGLAQGENLNIVVLCKHINKLAKYEDSILNLLTNMFYRMRLPNDNEISLTLKNLDFYQELKNYSKFILGKVEEYNAKTPVDFRKSEITIEHIMPQKLDEIWQDELGQDCEKIHQKYKHNIGNLILTEFNSEIGNKSFNLKKAKIKASSLFYRLDIIEKERWDENSIKEHQTKMIEWILQTFPLSDNYKTRENWNTSMIDKETSSFSPLDKEAPGLAEGNKPKEIKIGNKIVKVKTWQDVFLEFLYYLKHNDYSAFEEIILNQSNLFNKKEPVIIKWEDLKPQIDSRNELRSRYKNLDGEYYYEVRNLNDDELFVHVNMSASSCIARVYNIMNRFGMMEDFFTIVLK